ncbi:hypothetical protein N7478_005285 [Penicillium angulare]|uniref:uncharacterized protein n=1 Tax=Penicillium angulare TaxID=116970 RepID=UPI0025408CB0|nr:uncharacterized protein N7478_005285 [Penicillium angulare]KAJ5279913.1 hypothetical protein N7478_005285 [Penicillium angulare]
METAEPVSSYDFPGHVGAFTAHRRMESSLYPYYSHPPSNPSYSLPYHAPPTTAYHFGSLNQTSHPYGHYFVASQPPLSSPVRLAEPQPLHSLPEIKPAKNAINNVGKRASDRELPGVAVKKQPSDFEFSTGVDVLMKAIQAKPESSPSPVQQSLPPLQQLAPSSYSSYQSYPSYAMSPPRCLMNSEGQLSRSGKKRKYTCTLPNCGKSFAQKTHLDIHTRAHTGDKPFICKELSCGQRFSQLGNLKTHERRHTGEKPYSCDICHKTFAQRGNVRAHKTTHLESKPFTCLLDSCGKTFTQLGNLKSHQNKFHASTLRSLTMRFSQITDTGMVNPQDRDLWEYFASLYKNSNKGIKGRGKDRRILTTKRSMHVADPKSRMQSMESEEDPTQLRRGSYEDNISMYTGGSSSDGDEPGPYFIDRRLP